MARWIRAAIFLAFVFSAGSAFGSTHFISKSLGSDANAGTTKAAPWAHLPGMPSCASNCASYIPVAGDQFILRGGDTWLAADLGVNWVWSGTLLSRIYIGVDKTWFSGAAFTRPIFNCQASECNSLPIGSVFWIGAGYVTVDNIEFTGVRQNGNFSQAVGALGLSAEVENCYIHGMTRTSNTSNAFGISLNISSGDSAVLGAKFHDNVIDNSDSANLDFFGGILHADAAYNNVIRFVYNNNGNFTDFHGNLVEDNYVSASGDHCNMLLDGDRLTGTHFLAYNNIFDQKLSFCSGGATLWVLALTSGTCGSCVSYVFNNVIYDTSNNFAPQGIVVAGHQAAGNIGTVYIFNNTIQPDNGFCMGSGEVGASLANVHFANNHCVTSEVGICQNAEVTCIDDGGNLKVTTANANAAGYSDAQTYAFSPTKANGPTVGTGISGQTYCTALDSIDATAAAACRADIDYITYDSVNHTVLHPRTPLVRPAGSAAWDVGAYQFQAVTPPNGAMSLMATPH